MKKIKIAAALIVCVAMLLALAGCGGDAAKFPGTWRTGPMDFTAAFNKGCEEALSEEDANYFHVDEFKFSFVFTFEDGKYTLKPNADSLGTAIDGLKEQLKGGVEAMYIDLAQKNNLSIEDVLTANNYESLDALVQETLDEMDLSAIADELIKDATFSGIYTALLGKLILNGEDNEVIATFDYKFDGDKLVLSAEQDPDSEYGDIFAGEIICEKLA